MYVFAKKKDDAENPVPAAESKPRGKGRPTPKRKEAESARRRPVIIGDPKQRKQLSRAERKRERERRNELLARQQEALMNGDERYLPARDKGKARRFMRDFVDSRYTLSEWMIPLVFISLFISIAFASKPQVNTYVVYTTYVLFFLSLSESVYYWLRAKKALREDHPKWDTAPRSWWYVFSRMLMIRRWRRPVPMVKRGEYPQ